jgi:hypothetical protein
MLTIPARAIRWLLRDHETPKRVCWACYARSNRHPAGALRRYTTATVAGLPVCERHSLAEFAELIQ